MSKKEITLKEFADELIARIEKDQSIDCCKDELKRLAKIVGEKLPEEKIMVDWVD